MKTGDGSKELYKQLRALPWSHLWREEVARFDRAGAKERRERVSVVRAVGVVFSETGPAEQKDEVKQWLLRLLYDPEEKIRRYAMAALPKIGAGADDEAELLALLRETTSEREQKFLGETLNKIGGAATLDAIAAAVELPAETEQRARASVARSERRSMIRLDGMVERFERLRIHLRGRRGLEGIMRDEVEAQGRFSVVAVDRGVVAITPRAPFSLADIFALRCFDTVGVVLGLVKPAGAADTAAAIAAAISSPFAQRIFDAFTDGPIRYRLEFQGKGHQRATVRRIADRVFALCPRILNDAREAPWAADIHTTKHGDSVELRPRLSPDPRRTYRLDDVPAASHPPLAACMARLAGRMENEAIWDPFCGSGLELLERVALGGVARVYGSDRSAEAIEIIRRHFDAAQVRDVETHFACCDFREFADIAALAPENLTLVISNPPLGRRVRIPNLRELFDSLFAVSAKLLKPGGRLVFTNPFRMESPVPSLKLQTRQVVDLGGFDCRLEVYRKTAG